MATDKMVEAIAKAIFEADWERSFDSAEPYERDHYCHLALAALTAAEQVRASEPSVARDAAIELAAKKIYEAKGDRLGKKYIGWDKEPDEVKDDWRVDVRATIDAYEAARQL